MYIEYCVSGWSNFFEQIFLIRRARQTLDSDLIHSAMVHGKKDDLKLSTLH